MMLVDLRPDFVDGVSPANHPFPFEISDNPLILYHGTSSYSESLIEAEGFHPGRSRFSRVDLVALDDIFSKLDWNGLTGKSRAVLKPFCIDHDMREGRVQPIFLAESAIRAAGFACLDNAGGEIARSVRFCFEELDQYLEDSQIRCAHEQHLARRRSGVYHFDRQDSGYSSAYDLASLANDLKSLTHLRLEAFKAQTNHHYGVVYAIKLTPSDFKGALIDANMGIQIINRIQVEQMVAKFIVPNFIARKSIHSPDQRYFGNPDPSYLLDRITYWRSLA